MSSSRNTGSPFIPQVLRSSRRLPSMALPMNEYDTVGSGREGWGGWGNATCGKDLSLINNS
ncbi:hypothetical protein, partial [Akkermansia sp.]|uniref:hypothetical protein n=1 Tax=Akkermansia sp. TaxID=1872421 RepID=UPI002841E83D